MSAIIRQSKRVIEETGATVELSTGGTYFIINKTWLYWPDSTFFSNIKTKERGEGLSRFLKALKSK